MAHDPRNLIERIFARVELIEHRPGLYLQDPNEQFTRAVWIGQAQQHRQQLITPHFGYYMPDAEMASWELTGNIFPAYRGAGAETTVMLLNRVRALRYVDWNWTLSGDENGIVEAINEDLRALPVVSSRGEYLQMALSEDAFPWGFLSAIPLAVHFCVVAGEAGDKALGLNRLTGSHTKALFDRMGRREPAADILAKLEKGVREHLARRRN